MHKISITHLPINCLMVLLVLWCIGSFLLVGRTFTLFDKAAIKIEQEFTQRQISNVRKILEAEIDKGASIGHITKMPDLFKHYVGESEYLLSLFVFETETDKIVYSTVSEQIGIKVPWNEQCSMQNTFFIDREPSKLIIGSPIFNSFNKRLGCVVAEYKTKVLSDIRDNTLQTAFNNATIFCLLGLILVSLIYIFPYLSKYFNISPVSKHIYFWLIILTISGLVPYRANKMFIAFEKDIHPLISGKSLSIAKEIQYTVKTGVNNGIPFTSMNSAENYLENIRKDNPEILFILITDKSGRVLYEAGSATNAFNSDATGQITLKSGYFNIAEQINATPLSQKDSTLAGHIGWVQIGINERYIREKLF
ncbi:MAG: hypothetical protein MJ247_00320 [Alphaproteobacteria bacterium]|nr:hypothetical protein [Alphaproteobacteria bacterium]